MFYVDSQRTLTRRESSLIVNRKELYKLDLEGLSTGRAPSAGRVHSFQGSFPARPRGAIQKELVTSMFESMLDAIVESWDVISQRKPEESFAQFGKTASELTLSSKKKKQASAAKSSRINKVSSCSKLELIELQYQLDPLHQVWWSGNDEKAIVKFRNGNVYEGNISKKCMNGEGRFQWADGTVYLGQFKDNEITGKGLIHWKDDTWYKGDFLGNLRHGRGLFVDSRKQRSYIGGWHCGTKHGQGVIYYSKTFKNSYDGDWSYNVRHGFGSREYCSVSGYKGEWNQYVREGKGLMIWPNHDFYRGSWKNGVMSGYGIYIWEACYNNTMSLPSISVYSGQWNKGQRNGYGHISFGYGMGSHYKGEFKNNAKHGAGKLVTNSGLILCDKPLFVDDNIKSIYDDAKKSFNINGNRPQVPLQPEPVQFNICDSTAGLSYHIEQALANVDNDDEIQSNIVSDYIENNKGLHIDMSVMQPMDRDEKESSGNSVYDIVSLTVFEEKSLLNALKCYETDLRKIYYKYATICNAEEINFTPVLIRLYLWQFYYDCNIHEKSLTLVEIDKLFHRNSDWLSKSAHDPFEKIYYWQFIHNLIGVASRLYSKRQLPERKPYTIMATAFRMFMDTDVLPGLLQRKGALVNGFGKYIPLKEVYVLYKKIGEPHTVRTFIQEVRIPSHVTDKPQPLLVDAPDECVPVGRNTYIFGDEMSFITDEPIDCTEELDDEIQMELRQDLMLFNFGNLSCRTIIKIFSSIFPQICEKGKIIDLNIELTFFEFFEAFMTCAQESIRVKEEELLWRQKFESRTPLASATRKHN